MYGLEKSVKLDFLHGRELIQVAIGSHQVILIFDLDATVTIEGLCELSAGRDSALKIHAETPEETSQLTQLLNCKISNAINNGDGSITLEFTKGLTLRLIDSNKNFESYQINAPSAESVIV